MADPDVLQEALALQQMKTGLADHLAALSQQLGLPETLGTDVIGTTQQEVSKEKALETSVDKGVVDSKEPQLDRLSTPADAPSNVEGASQQDKLPQQSLAAEQSQAPPGVSETADHPPAASSSNTSDPHLESSTAGTNRNDAAKELEPESKPVETAPVNEPKGDVVPAAFRVFAKKTEKDGNEGVSSSLPAAFRKGVKVPSKPYIPATDTSITAPSLQKSVDTNAAFLGTSLASSAPMGMWPGATAMMPTFDPTSMATMGGMGGMMSMSGMPGISGMGGMLGMSGMPGIPGMGGMPGMSNMGGMSGMDFASMAGMSGMAAMPGMPGMPGMSCMGMVGMMPETRMTGSMGNEEDEKETAIREAVEATQHAQYMQQMQFLQQMRAQASQVDPSQETRFNDDYRPLRLCRHFMIAECQQGGRCIYAHCFEELHPASPDLPKNDDSSSSTAALAEMKPQEKEEESAPNMRLRKKRDLCKKFMETGTCLRGKACPYAHGEHEIGSMAFVLYDKVKLKICQHWAQGRCIYEDKCINAHGKQEIGQKRRDFFDMPPVKRRREDESIEEWRSSILRNPSRTPFS